MPKTEIFRQLLCIMGRI